MCKKIVICKLLNIAESELCRFQTIQGKEILKPSFSGLLSMFKILRIFHIKPLKYGEQDILIKTLQLR